MKILVATKDGQGKRKNDFCWAEPGELVVFGSECDGEDVDGRCGCRRSLVGIRSHKATTTFKVEERETNLRQLSQLIYHAKMAGGWAPSKKDCMEDARELKRIAATFPVNDVVERRGGYFQVRK